MLISLGGRTGSRKKSGRRVRRLTVALLLHAALLLSATASAQLLTDVLTATAVQAQFSSAVRFPPNTLRASGAGVNALLGRVEGASNWTEWEAYTLGGAVAGLAAAVDHQVTTAFAVAGLLEESRDVKTVTGPSGQETHTHIVYVSDSGERRLLYFVRAGNEVVWLTARAK